MHGLGFDLGPGLGHEWAWALKQALGAYWRWGIDC